VTVPAAAHLLFEEQPAICAALIHAHIERVGWSEPAGPATIAITGTDDSVAVPGAGHQWGDG
jgi:hypothetical protein